jgi:Domain of unknown function (DUF4034)
VTWWRLGMAAVLAWALTTTAAAQTETWPTIDKRAEQAYWWGDFDQLQRLHDQYLRPGERVPTGALKLSAFGAGLSRVVNHKIKQRTEYLAELEALTLRWTQQHPRSSLAHSMHAEVLMAVAWSYRGTGFANTVPPQAWAEFRTHVQRAVDHMVKHADTALSTSEGHVTMLNVGRAAGWTHERQWAIAQAGLKLSPHDDRLYLKMVLSLLPKWGGSGQQVDRFINEAVERTKAERGLELYARLYHEAAVGQYGAALFAESGADWSRMKQGFEDLLGRHADPFNVNRFAYYACLAQDKPTTLDLMGRLGATPDLDAWGDNAAGTFETCKRWAGRQ